MAKSSLLTPDEMSKLLYTLDEVLPQNLTNGDLSTVCAYIAHRYGLRPEDASGVYAESLRFLRHAVRGCLDATPPSSDLEIN